MSPAHGPWRRSPPALGSAGLGWRHVTRLPLCPMTAIEPGTEIAGFVVEAVAGRGGMGVVYRARQLRPERLVALKVISPELAHDSGFQARFERESEIAAQI